MRGRSGQLKKNGTGMAGFRKANGNRDAIDQQMEPPRAPVQRTDGIGQVSQIFNGRRGIVGRRHELDVAYRVLSPPQRAGGRDGGCHVT